MPDLRPAVLLDVDGTLLDTNYLHVLAWWQAIEDTGRGPIPMSAIHRAIGIPSDGLVRHLLGEDDEKTVDAHSRRYEPLRENVNAEIARGAGRDLAASSPCGRESAVAVGPRSRAATTPDLEWSCPAIGAGDAVDRRRRPPSWSGRRGRQAAEPPAPDLRRDQRAGAPRRRCAAVYDDPRPAGAPPVVGRRRRCGIVARPASRGVCSCVHGRPCSHARRRGDRDAITAGSASLAGRSPDSSASGPRAASCAAQLRRV